MSNRDDDVKKSDGEENNDSSVTSDKKSPDGEIYSTKQKITHTIRQNPLAHMGENSVKLTFWEKVKRAFSTDDTYGAGFIDDEKYEDGLLGSDDIKGLFAERVKVGRFGKKTDEHDTSNTEMSETNAAKQPKPFDSEDALEGGAFEFVAAETTGDVVYTEEDAEAAEEELDYELALNMLFTDDEAEQMRIEKEKAQAEKIAEETAQKAKEESEESEKFSAEIDNNTDVEPQDKPQDDLPMASAENSLNNNGENIEVQQNSEVPLAENIGTDEPQTEQNEDTQSKAPTAELTENSTNDELQTEQSEDTQGKAPTDTLTENPTDGEPQNKKSTGERSKANNVADEVKKAGSVAAARIKGFFDKTKNTLVKMWNEKLPESTENTANSQASTPVSEVIPADDIKAESVSNSTAEEQAQMLEGLLPDEQNAHEEEKPPIITVIKNEDTATTEIDTKKVRDSLNVIDTAKQQEEFEIILEEPDILYEKPQTQNEKSDKEYSEPTSESKSKTPQQIRQERDNQKVLEKVKQAEEWIAAQKKSPEEIAKKERAYEKAFGEVKPLDSITVNDYVPQGRVNTIKVRAGRFTESVRSEYDFYIGYRTLKKAASNQSRIENVSKKINESVKSEEAKTVYDDVESESDTFAKSRDRLNIAARRLDAKDKKNPRKVEYRSENDTKRVTKFILNDCSKSKRSFYITAVITVVMFVFFMFSGKFASSTAETSGLGSGSERVFVFINLLLFGGALFISKDTITGGLKPLRNFRTNADTGVAVACAAVLVQSLAAFIAPTFFFRQSMILYTLPAMLPLTLNAWGKYMTACRAKENFKFLSGSFGKYTAKFYHDQRAAAQILSGTSLEKSEIVFHKRASFFKHFMELSYEEDPGEKLSSRVAIPAAVFSVIITVIYTCLSKSFLGALSVLSIMLCMSVPMCGRLLASMPLYHLARSSIKSDAMIIGYPAVEEFSETGAIMIDAKDLYPEGTVHMNGIKTFGRHRIDDELIAAAAVMVHAGGAMAGMFDGIIEGDKEKKLPPVESMIYEDGKGLIGWVNKKRVLIGNRYLLEEHGIVPPDEDYEDKYRTNDNEITYLASSGELVAMFIISYSANRRVKETMRRMEETGMCFLIRTVDSNITADRISKDFGIYYKRVKILPTSQGNVLRDEMIGKEKTAPAYIATKGSIVSLGRAVSGCIKAKKNISLSLAIQIIEMLLGLLVVTMIVLFSGIQQIGSVMLFLFLLFWSAAVIAAPFIQKS